jgi:hypothetical protein
MRKSLVLAMVVLSTMLAVNAFAATYANQTITFEIMEISQISVSDNPGPLVISLLDEFGDLVSATDATTTYDITTNEVSQRITGELSSSMPDYTTLEVALDAPTGGDSYGQVVLTTSPQYLVTGISTLSETELTIGYEFSATIAAQHIHESYRTVTLTIADAL